MDMSERQRNLERIRYD